MVEDYRLTRAADEQLAEGLHRQDEEFEPVTFKRWLQAFEWDGPDQHDHTDEHTDPVERARAAVWAIPQQRRDSDDDHGPVHPVSHETEIDQEWEGWER